MQQLMRTSNKALSCHYAMVFAVATCLWQAPAVLGADNVMGRWQQANRAFLQADYVEARRLLKDNIDAHPDHKPSLLLMGRTLYHLQEYGDAARYFDKIDGSKLGPDTAFEYGYVMFAAGHYVKALRGFQLIPKEHQYKNYARFYSGICYLRLGASHKAYIKLSKATGLPPMVNVLRRQLMELARQDTESSAGSKHKGDIDLQTAPLNAENGGGGASKKGEKKAFTASATPNAEVKYESITNEYNGLEHENIVNMSTMVKADISGKYVMSDKGTVHPYLALSLSQKHFDQQTSGGQSTYTVVDKTSGIVNYEYSDKVAIKLINNETTVAPTFGLAISDKTDISIKGEYYEIQSTDPTVMEGHISAIGTLHSTLGEVDIDTGLNATRRWDNNDVTKAYEESFSGSLAKHFSKTITTLSGSYLLRQMPSGMAYTLAASEAKGALAVTVPISEFSLYSALSYRHLTPGDGRDYVNWDKLDTTTFDFNIERPFDFGLSLKLASSYALFTTFGIEGLPVNSYYGDAGSGQTAVGKADGTTASCTFTATQQILSFMYVSASAKYEVDQFSVLETDMATGFYKATVSNQVEWNVVFGVKKSF